MCLGYNEPLARPLRDAIREAGRSQTVQGSAVQGSAVHDEGLGLLSKWERRVTSEGLDAEKQPDLMFIFKRELHGLLSVRLGTHRGLNFIPAVLIHKCEERANF